MPDRLTPLDASFLYLESTETPMHVGSVMVFAGIGRARRPVDHVRLVKHVEARIAFVPRYRQRLRTVPGRLANPVWVDDENFDIDHHVRQSALPAPGTLDQLAGLVAELQARPLARDRPLWELTLVEGLEDGRFAVVTKVHQALVDGVHAVDLGQVVLDTSPDSYDPPAQTWTPAPEPTLVELVVGAVSDSVRSPQQVVETLRSGIGSVRSSAGSAFEVLGELAARTAARPTQRSPLNQEVGADRRFCMVSTDLEDYREIRDFTAVRRRRTAGRVRAGTPRDTVVTAATGGRVFGPVPDPSAVPAPAPESQAASVTDVVLATLAGGLRAWLLTRGEPIRPSSMVRALVPFSIHPDGTDPEGAPAGAIGSDLAWLLVDLPTGEQSPLMRLHQVAYQTRAHREGGRGVEARALAGIAGFAPPTLHSLGARAASGLSRRLFNVVVTNVPGPQLPLYLRRARMLASYPVIPLARGQALSVGLTSYDGGVYYGLYADRAAMPDLAVLGQCVVDSLAEMIEAVR
ncbi:MAG: diacylglycerol O-acyltransferase / wax synthase [Actinomycetota bacterium]|nr:diacylglycerol O-acyltransferase / wax synthase [Actinomycetota bacterium]